MKKCIAITVLTITIAVAVAVILAVRDRINDETVFDMLDAD